MANLIFISGGASSGKSEYAENKLIEISGNDLKIYLAAMKINNNDPEILRRIENHRKMRADKNFKLIEAEKNFSNIIPANSSVLIESLSSWLANEMFNENNNNINLNSNVVNKIFNEIMTIKNFSHNLIIVSDDIFSDGIIYDEMTELYIKNLAQLHIKTAQISNEALEIVSGLKIKYV